MKEGFPLLARKGRANFEGGWIRSATVYGGRKMCRLRLSIPCVRRSHGIGFMASSLALIALAFIFANAAQWSTCTTKPHGQSLCVIQPRIPWGWHNGVDRRVQFRRLVERSNRSLERPGMELRRGPSRWQPKSNRSPTSISVRCAPRYVAVVWVYHKNSSTTSWICSMTTFPLSKHAR